MKHVHEDYINYSRHLIRDGIHRHVGMGEEEIAAERQAKEWDGIMFYRSLAWLSAFEAATELSSRSVAYKIQVIHAVVL